MTSPTTRTVMVFAASGGKCRSEVTLFRDSKKKEQFLLFDGDTYQYYEPNGGMLSYSSSPHLDNLSFDLNPLLVPFGFLFKEVDVLSHTSMLDEATWTRFANKASIESNASDGVVVTYPDSDSDYSYTVYFDEYHYPRKFEVVDGNGIVVSDVVVNDCLRSEMGDAGIVVIPTELTVRNLTEDFPLQTIEFEIAPGTLKVNEPIHDDVFSIPRSQATYLVNKDNRTLMQPDGTIIEIPEHSVASEEPRSAVWRYSILAINVLLLVLLSAIVIIIRRRAA